MSQRSARDARPGERREACDQIRRSPGAGISMAGAEPFTVVVPCFNEAEGLPQLQRNLGELDQVLAPRPVHYVFVDDGSTDGTLEMLRDLFGRRPRCCIVAHARNRGLTAAIMTGIAAAETELVGSMDSDCTYDPRLFAQLLPRLTPDVALVTASPYHPDGAVRNVPAWRLLLSKTLSGIYRLLLTDQLHTFTSCFRVYRKTALAGLQLEAGGFVGMAEMLVRLDELGARVEECPAELRARVLGVSKMRTLRTIRAHLGLLARLVLRRLGKSVLRTFVNANSVGNPA